MITRALHWIAGVFGVIVISIASAGRLCAQTVLTTTTLNSAMSDSNSRTVPLAASTGVTAVGTGTNAVFLVVDREIMGPVNSINTTTNVATVAIRGANGSRATPHVSGATVTIAPPASITTNIPAGQCTRTNLLYVPIVIGGSAGLGAEVGTMYDCLGVTTAGQFVQTNGTGSIVVKGSTVASATTIAATGNYFAVSGTTSIQTITVPAGWGLGQCLTIEPTAVFNTSTAGNIQLATTAVVSKMLFECWNGTKWSPSY